MRAAPKTVNMQPPTMVQTAPTDNVMGNHAHMTPTVATMTPTPATKPQKMFCVSMFYLMLTRSNR